jgi:serine/threonine protein kinase
VPGTPESSLTGTVLDGRYELLEPIGAGGVGEVYRARLLKLDRIVAVKVLHESLVTNGTFVDGFQREARAISRMHHPHCVAVLDFGVLESRPYLVLEYLPGKTVTSLLDAGRFPPARAVWIALQLLDTLSYFHGQNVIHRDLKSENLMLVSSGAIKDFLKVLDFGMAKILDVKDDDSQLTKAGLVPGTVSAMAPEQLKQLAPDNRIDIYATGILLFEMIVGRRPFRGPDPAVVAKMQLESPPPRPRELLGEAGLSGELERIILKALEKDRTKRFDSAQQMAEALLRTKEGRSTRTRMAAISAPPPLPVQTPASPAVVAPPASPAVVQAPASDPASLAPPPPREASAPPAAPWPARRRRWLAGAGAAACLIVLLAWGKRSPHKAAPRPQPAPAVVAKPPPPPPAPSPAPVAPTEEPPAPASPSPTVPWMAHRDLAVVYAGRGEALVAFHEVKAALEEDATAAAEDRALLDAAIAALTPRNVPFLLGAFRANEHLVEALVAGTTASKNALQRHAAVRALARLHEGARVDVVAMRIVDLQQASTCAEMRSTFKKLSASKDPRVGEFADQLRERPSTDPQARCLRSLLDRHQPKPRT